MRFWTLQSCSCSPEASMVFLMFPQAQYLHFDCVDLCFVGIVPALHSFTFTLFRGSLCRVQPRLIVVECIVLRQVRIALTVDSVLICCLHRCLRRARREPISIDWKTTSRYTDEPEGLLSLDPQLICYSWVTGVSEVALVVFVRKHQPEIQYLKTSITAEQRQEFGRLLGVTINRIEAAQFPSHNGIRFRRTAA